MKQLLFLLVIALFTHLPNHALATGIILPEEIAKKILDNRELVDFVSRFVMLE